jgi:hypothetical protein
MYQKPYGFMRQEKILVVVVIVAFMLAALAPAVAAEEKPAENGWEFHVAPYLWAIAMKGNVTVKGVEADVDLSFSDIWDELNFALMLAYEARKGNWGLWGNTIYANLGDSNIEGPAWPHQDRSHRKRPVAGVRRLLPAGYLGSCGCAG